jgi:hypothetical protein
MKLNRRLGMVLLTITSAFLLTACAGEEENSSTEDHNSHANMEHSGTGELPEGLKEAADPTYEVGSQAIIKDDHMPGMDGAEATIAGAYDTVVYSLSYDPTNGGDRVEQHKWVIHEELLDAGAEPLQPGDETTINTDHMEGMQGAKAVIDSAEEMTVYMVDFTPTDGSEKVTNHQWVTEDELAPAK